MHYRIVTRIIIVLLLLCLPGIMTAQTGRIDFLKKELVAEKEPQARLNTILRICEQNYSLPVNTFFDLIKQGEKIAPVGSPEYFKIKTFYCHYLSKIDRSAEALALNDSLTKVLPSDASFKPISDILAVRRCGLLIRNNQPKDAIELALQLLEKAEQSHDTIMVVRNCSIFLGWANMELEKYTEAIRWLRFGDNYGANESLLKQCNALYSNMASCYNNIQKYDSALYFINIALKYCRQQEELTGMANSLNIRADIYINTNNPTAAEEDMKEAVKVREQMGDLLYIVSDMAQLSFFYASIKQTDKGIETAEKGITLARKSNNISKLIFLYSALAENYKTAGIQDKYAASLLSLMNLKDTLYKENSTKAIAEMEAKYQLQKKENIIIRQKFELNRSRYTAIGSVALLIVGLLFVWLLYRNYRLSQRRKMELAIAEEKLLSYKAVEQAEENERKRIAANLHDNLGSYAAAITANVKNLKDGSGEDADSIMVQLDENAQNMVTQLSDTIWVLKNEQLPVTKLADRFKVWTQRLIQNYPHVKYHYSENIVDDIEFTPAKILHIFLILKECVNNALKHSECSDLVINFFSEGHWVICIEDNGKGFTNVANPGSGIDNIKRRAAECGWNVEWVQLNPKGTLVIISETTTK